MVGFTIGGGLSPTICCGAHSGVQPKIVMDGVLFKGKFFPAYGGLYTRMSDNPSFIRGGLENISRALKAEIADAGVVVEDNNQKTNSMQNNYRVVNVELVRTIVPEGTSGGTGYSQYADLRVTFDGGNATDVRISYYYTTAQDAFKEFLEHLPGCDNAEETYALFGDAIRHLLLDFCAFSELPESLRKPEFKTEKKKIYRIRKLTPRECFRLMGVSDSDIDKIQAYPFHEAIQNPSFSKDEILAGMTEQEKRKLMKDSISESQQYKMAGNSIVVNVLEGIFTQLFRADTDCLF